MSATEQAGNDNASALTDEVPQTAPMKSVDELADQQDPGLVAEFWDFIKNHKKWWLTPIILVLLLLGVLLVVGSSGAAPFIYTLF